MQNQEIEIKLAMAGSDLEKFRGSRLLRTLSTEPAKRKHLLAYYFDTDDHVLSKHRMSLRVRRESGQWIQTLKGVTQAQGGLQQRSELQVRVKQPQVDLDAFGEAAEKTTLASLLDGAGLQQVFVTDIRRTIRLVEFAKSKMEMAIDTGWIRSGRAKTAVSEVELELLQGKAADVIALANHILETHPFSIGIESKAEQGYRLNAKRPPQASHGSQVTILKSMSPWQTAVALIQSRHVLLVRNAVVLADRFDSESLCVAEQAADDILQIRRIFKDCCPANQWSSLHSVLLEVREAIAEVRQWDTLVEKAESEKATQAVRHHDFRQLLRRLKSRRQAAHKRLKTFLGDRGYTRYVLDMEAWLQLPARKKDAGRTIAGEYAPVLKHLRSQVLKSIAGSRKKKFNQNSLPRLHRKMKQLLLSAKSFAALRSGRKSAKFIKLGQQIEDRLACAYQLSLLPQRLDSLDGDSDSKTAEEVDYLRRCLNTEIVEQEKQIRKLWRKFGRAKVYG